MMNSVTLVLLVILRVVESRSINSMAWEHSTANSKQFSRRQDGGDVKKIGPTGNLLYEDTFDSLNLDFWKHDISVGDVKGSEFQFYYNNRTSSYVEDGNLVLKPVLTSTYLGIPDGDLLKPDLKLDLHGNSRNSPCTSDELNGCTMSGDGVKTMVQPVMSTQIRSIKNLNFAFGRVDVRAKLPKGDWLKPSIYLLPTNNNYGPWPASGEIDLVDSTGNKPGFVGDGVDTMSSTLHWGTDIHTDRFDLTTKAFKLPDGKTFADDFHLFSLEWTSDYIRTWVDEVNLVLDLPMDKSFWDRGGFDKKVGTNNPWRERQKVAPFDQKFYMVINLAVANSKPGKDSSPNNPVDFYKAKEEWYPTWQQPGSAEFRIDYVRVYS